MTSAVLKPDFPLGLSPRSSVDLAGAYRTMLLVRRFEEKLGQLVALGLIKDAPLLTRNREPIAAAVGAVHSAGAHVVSSTAHEALLLACGVPATDLFEHLIAGRAVERKAFEARLAFMPDPREALAEGLNRAMAGDAVLCWISAAQWIADPPFDMLADVRERPCPLVCLVDGESGPLSAGDPIGAVIVPVTEMGYVNASLDGGDAAGLIAAVQTAVTSDREGRGPVVFAVRTPPFVGHIAAARATGAGSRIASSAESDPLPRLRARLLAEGLATESALKHVEKQVRDEVISACASARACCEDSGSPT